MTQARNTTKTDQAPDSALERTAADAQEYQSSSVGPDPALQQATSGAEDSADTYAGQQGYGVSYSDGQYTNESAGGMEGAMRPGSFETGNIGNQTASQGYPQGGPDGGPSTTASPDPDTTAQQPDSVRGQD